MKTITATIKDGAIDLGSQLTEDDFEQKGDKLVNRERIEIIFESDGKIDMPIQITGTFPPVPHE